MVRWSEVLTMAHLHPYCAEGSLEHAALPALTNSDSEMLAQGHHPPTETDTWVTLIPLASFACDNFNESVQQIWGHGFVKELQLFRTLGLCMTKQPPVRRPCYAWPSSPADVEGEGWQGSIHPCPFIYHAISSMLAVFVVLFSVWKIFYACHRRKGNNVWKKKWLALKNTLSQEFGKLSYFPSFVFLFLSLSLCFLFLFFVFVYWPHPFPPLLPPLLFFKGKVHIYQMSITCSVFYIHKGVVHCIIFKCILINTRNI